jgi:hypothetical protein
MVSPGRSGGVFGTNVLEVGKATRGAALRCRGVQTVAELRITAAAVNSYPISRESLFACASGLPDKSPRHKRGRGVDLACDSALYPVGKDTSPDPNRGRL